MLYLSICIGDRVHCGFIFNKLAAVSAGKATLKKM